MWEANFAFIFFYEFALLTFFFRLTPPPYLAVVFSGAEVQSPVVAYPWSGRQAYTITLTSRIFFKDSFLYRAWAMSPEQSQYIWRKTIPHIEVGMGSGVFTSYRSARFVLIPD